MAGRGRVSRVEVSLDGGARWQDAALQEPVQPTALTVRMPDRDGFFPMPGQPGR